MTESEQLDEIEAAPCESDCDAVTPEALAWARKFLTYRWCVVHCADGGIQFERHDSGFDIEVTFTGDGELEIYAQPAAALAPNPENSQKVPMHSDEWLQKMATREEGHDVTVGGSRMVIDEIPRRCRLDRMVAAEKAIYEAAQAVEAMPADVRLTAAVILLWDARNKVADFVDGVEPAAALAPHPVRPEDNEC